jgi:uncharacterized protein with von Willebrand factor type A (vWA) domain
VSGPVLPEPRADESGRHGSIPPRPILPGIDRAAFAAGFAARLRAAGVPVDLSGVGAFVAALAAAPPVTRSGLYWSARITLVRDPAELATFDALFAAVFADAVLAVDPHARRRSLPGLRADDRAAGVAAATAEADGAGLPWATRPRAAVAAEEPAGTTAVPLRLPSHLAGLAELPFEDLSPADMGLLGRWLAAAAPGWPRRRTRRLRPSPAGHRIALRPTLALARRTGWETVELVRVAPRYAPRRVLMLCDVSRSMQAQATAYLHLMRGLALRGGETFAFATRLTRLTGVLTHRCPQAAVEQASAKVDDRFGGTRIATNVEALLRSRHGQRVRGAIVIIASDGWDADPPERLARAMGRLRRRAFRIVWINPRAGAPGFVPRVAGMAAALPYCDELLPADTFASLARVLDQIGRCDALGPRRGKVSTA